MQLENSSYDSEMPILYPPRVVSGMRPTAQVHLGHYFGALQHHIELHHRYPGQSFFVIADYHALTTPTASKDLREGVYEVVATYLSLGLDPQKAYIYRQSDVPEAIELFWLLSCYSHLSELDRVPTVKSLGDRRGSSILSLYAYPVLMAADILGTRATLVPVGEDQQSYVELTREIARRVNRACQNDLFPEPRILLSTSPIIPGIDGKKMCHRELNAIGMFEKYSSLKTKVHRITTDSKGIREPKDTNTCTIFKLFALVAKSTEIETMKKDYESGAIGYDHAKKLLLASIQDRFHQYEDRYSKLRNDTDFLEDVLRQGFQEVRSIMQETLHELREHLGILPT